MTHGPLLEVVVGPGAAVCLDLILRDAGLVYHHARGRPLGACVLVDLVDEADGNRIVDVLRQHLGAELREASIYHHGVVIRIHFAPSEAVATPEFNMSPIIGGPPPHPSLQ